MSAELQASAELRTFPLSRVIVFLSLIYVAEAACGPSGLLSQPLMRFAKEGLRLTPTQISLYLSLIASPWILKPLYGAVSDLLPIFRYRRRSYLVIANLAVILAYVVLAQSATSRLLLGALLTISAAMALASAVAGGVLVENGQRLGVSGILANYQWFWLNITLIFGGLAGGWLTQHLQGDAAVRTAALILIIPVAVALVATLTVLDEQQTKLTVATVSRTLANFGLGLTRRRLLILAAFVFLYMFSPGFNVPLYFHLSNDLHLTQGTIGILNAIGSAGSVLGAVVYRFWLVRLRSVSSLFIAIGLGLVSTLAYLLLVGPVSAACIYFAAGTAGTIAIITSVTLVADYCPKGAESLTFSLLATAENFALRMSDLSGSYLYDHVTGRQMQPLILISAACTLLALPLIPALGLGEKRQGEPVRDVPSAPVT